MPHTAFHALNPSPLLTSAQDAQNVAVLVFSVVAAVVLLVGSQSTRGDREVASRRAVPA